MPRKKDVKEFEYPSKVTKSGAIKGLWQASKISTIFHLLMTVLTISGLLIDLLGDVLGGSLFTVRQVFHGYVGVVFVVILPIYLIQIIATKKTRMLMTTTNYVNFILYLILLVSGISIASANKPWIDAIPWLFNSLSSIRQITPMLHTFTTYLWLLISLIAPGGFLHGIATAYLISINKRKNKTANQKKEKDI